MPRLEIDRWNEGEHRLLTLMAEVDRAEVTSAEDSLNRAALLETVRRELRESKERVAALLVRRTSDDA